ncbi:MAG: TlpA family protein disulfide reductase [Chloracidobacterium sp.]|nr:TlpA family protein disulfide reductase [Chloracidobacterium sp.]
MKTLRATFLTLTLALLVSAAATAQTSLTSVDGSRVDVEAQHGKVVVLAVGASWLPLSDKQAEYANALMKKYQGKPAVFYFVVTDSTNTKSKNFADTETLKKWAFTNKLAMPLLRDPDGAATLKKYDIDQIPSFVILDKNGNQSGEPFGGIDPKYDIAVPMSKAIDKLL